MEQLTEKGFVFIDERHKANWCRMVEDEPWLFYWHEGNKTWVTLRKVTQMDVWRFYEKDIGETEAKIYHDTNAQSLKKIHLDHEDMVDSMFFAIQTLGKEG